MAQHAALILGGLQMDGLGADNARDALFAAQDGLGHQHARVHAAHRRIAQIAFLVRPAHNQADFVHVRGQQHMRRARIAAALLRDEVANAVHRAGRAPLLAQAAQERANFLLAAGHAERRRQLLQ